MSGFRPFAVVLCLTAGCAQVDAQIARYAGVPELQDELHAIATERATLEAEKAELRAQVTALETENRNLSEKAKKLVFEVQGDDGTFLKIANWRVNAWERRWLIGEAVQEAQSLDVRREHLSYPEGCDDHELLRELMVAKIYWLKGDSLRLLAHPAFLAGDPAPTVTDIADLAPESVVRALKDQLSTIQSVPHWESKLSLFARQAEASQHVYTPTAEAYWEEGFPKADDPCLREGGMQYDPPDYDTDPVGPFYDYVSAEQWLYSFWTRRHREGTLDMTAAALDLLLPAEDAAEPATP